jgi:hypothetical protein
MDAADAAACFFGAAGAGCAGVACAISTGLGLESDWANAAWAAVIAVAATPAIIQKFGRFIIIPLSSCSPIRANLYLFWSREAEPKGLQPLTLPTNLTIRYVDKKRHRQSMATIQASVPSDFADHLKNFIKPLHPGQTP